MVPLPEPSSAPTLLPGEVIFTFVKPRSRIVALVAEPIKPTLLWLEFTLRPLIVFPSPARFPENELMGELV